MAIANIDVPSSLVKMKACGRANDAASIFWHPTPLFFETQEPGAHEFLQAYRYFRKLA